MNAEIKTAIIFGGLIAAGVVFLAILFIGLDESVSIIQDSGIKKAPDLVGISDYLNTSPEKLSKDMENKVILYDIWTYSCVNCIRTLPYITAWDEKYAEQGLLIIGIHSPEFEFEKNVENVQVAIYKYGIDYPVVLYNDMKIWKAFENNYWPRKYIADHQGNLRYDHIGEGGYKETEKIIQQLLEERSKAMKIEAMSSTSLVSIEEFEHTLFRSPELYFGYKFAQNRNQLGSEEGFQHGKIVKYYEPNNIELNKFYPIGNWNNQEDSMELTETNGSIKVSYTAKEVNIVTENYAELEIFIDGIPLTKEHQGTDIVEGNKLKVVNPGMYNIVSDETSSTHIMEIKIQGEGFRIFTFTFG